MQDRLGLNLNKNDRFALAEKFCYFGYAPAKSGVGIKTLLLRRDYSSYLVMVDRLRRSMRSAVFTLSSGSTNLGRSASISLVPNVGGKENLERGTTMQTSWCFLGGVCGRAINIFNQIIMPNSLFLGVAP